MAAGVRVAITLACTEQAPQYQTEKSKRNSPDRVEFKKRRCAVATSHRETR